MVQQSDGSLALTDPDGTHVTTLNALGVVGQSVSASPDDRYLSDGNGQVLAVRSGQRVIAYPSSVPLGSSNGAAWPDSFADHDHDLVMLEDYGAVHAETSSYSVQNPVWAASLSSGIQDSLGNADAVAGDPQAPGAFVSSAGSPVASGTPVQVTPDADVELRDAGHPPVVLATAAAINSDLGVVDQAVQLVPVPDGAGDKIAVVVRPVSGSGLGGIVVLDRAGQMLAATPPGPTFVPGLPAWSPDGKSLAYVAFGQGGGLEASLFIWHVGSQPRFIAIPKGASPQAKAAGGRVLVVPSWCIWSPDGKSVLCSTDPQAGQRSWAVTTITAREMTALPGPGFPVAWLPGGVGR